MSYQKVASLGMAWLAIGMVVSKLASFASIFVLGWYLSSEEFALYALAYSSSSVFIAIRNGGVQQILIQRGIKSFDRLSSLFFKYAAIFNLSAMFLLLGSMPVISKIYGNEVLSNIVLVIALSLPLSTFSMLYRAKLSTCHKFSYLAKFDMFSSIIRHSSSALLAFLGFGVFSFVLPLIIVGIFEILIGYWYVGKISFWSKRLTIGIGLKIFATAKWVVFASLASAIILQGDYLVLGLFESKEVVGQYFFGFQLTMAISVVITSGLSSVIMPIFSKLNGDEERQLNAFKKAFRIYSFSVLLFASFLIITADPLIKILWKGKWDEAIIVVQVIALSMVTRLLTPLGRSLLEAKKKWRLVSMLLAADAFGIVSAASLGVWYGGLLEVALFVSCYRFVYGVVYLVVVAKAVAINISSIFRPLAKVFIAGSVSLSYTFLYFNGLFEMDNMIIKSILLLFVYCLLVFLALWVVNKNQIFEFYGLLKNIKR